MISAWRNQSAVAADVALAKTGDVTQWRGSGGVCVKKSHQYALAGVTSEKHLDVR